MTTLKIGERVTFSIDYVLFCCENTLQLFTILQLKHRKLIKRKTLLTLFKIPLLLCLDGLDIMEMHDILACNLMRFKHIFGFLTHIWVSSHS
jgi:hypothetical protein